MPALSTNEAAERIARIVNAAKPATLAEIYAELFPERPVGAVPPAADLAQLVRSGLKAEELVDLWNVVFPADRNVWYDEEDRKIHYNDESLGYVETD
jgi:hypothetical protein